MRNKEINEIKQFVKNLVNNEKYDVNNVYDLTINYCNNLKVKLNSQEIKYIVDNVINSLQNNEKLDNYEDFVFKENSYLNLLECEDFEFFN